MKQKKKRNFSKENSLPVNKIFCFCIELSWTCVAYGKQNINDEN